MATLSTCTCCSSSTNLKQCKRCRTVAYCSTACQKKDWKAHKAVCRFTVIDEPVDPNPVDPLSLLLAIPALKISVEAQPHTRAVNVAEEGDDAGLPAASRTFKVAELRMAILSFLPALELLRAQQVCHSWYHTIATDRKLQQRLFLAPGPGELVFPAKKGKEVLLGIHPRNDSQARHATMTRGPAMSGGGPLHLSPTASGSTEQVHAVTLETNGISIVLNPFFTSLWPQDPKNMTSSPYITVTDIAKPASWRRMQLTSPPTLEADVQVWYTTPKGGKMLSPHIGVVSSGVTLGHLADLMAAQSPKLTLHWMQITAHAWWARSADAVVIPGEGDASNNNESRAGVYVNPSNGIAFPGAF